MRCAWITITFWLTAAVAAAQYSPPSENLHIQARKASTWTTHGRDGAAVSVLQLDGEVRVQTGHTVLSAQQAVLWLVSPRGALAEERRMEIALVGEARLEQPNGIVRSGQQLFVEGSIRGAVRLTAQERSLENLSGSDLYRLANAMRPSAPPDRTEQREAAQWLLRQPLGLPGTMPATAPSTQQARPVEPVRFRADSAQTTNQTKDGNVAFILEGHVLLIQQKRDGSLLEMEAQRAVLFTPLKDLRQLGQGGLRSREEAVVGAYLEGDVRITQTPPPTSGKAEQRLLANRVYYDTTTDRAVLSDVVLHSYDLEKQLPIVVRAQTVRQLSMGEIQADQARLSTSLFATPSYSLGASSLYVRQVPTGDQRGTNQTTFVAQNTTLRIGPVPVLWFPVMAGVWNDKGPLREVSLGQSRQRGFSVLTNWGLYETLGQVPPEDLDLGYSVNYYTQRGPALGLDGRYIGGFVTDFTRQPWTFLGSATAFGINDQGEDDMGKERLTLQPPSDWRGRVWWEHQHFVPDSWQVQLTAGYVSDPTFLEHWFQEDFNNSRQRDTSLYVRRQQDNEMLTFLTSVQPNNFPTASDLAQEQLAGIERVPELGYHRIGQSLADDAITWHSSNRISALRFQGSHASLAEQGYAPARGGLVQSPGLPSLGTTGTPSEVVYRGDLRQELGVPFWIDDYRAMPYVVGRYSAWSDTPTDGGAGRVYGGAGFRLSTSFWKTDDTLESRLLDIHRLRHVVEPQLHVFWGVSSRQADDVFIYDEPVDALRDLGAVQLALHQRWQTKRGGAGRWRNVDVLALSVEANWFFRRPDATQRNPEDFRGIFFSSLPEASLPRNGFNADWAWQISDTTALLADARYNADRWKLATASTTLQVQHEPRLSYSLGFRYIAMDFEQVVGGPQEPALFVFEDQKLLQVGLNYELTRRYTLDIAESYDFAGRGNIRSNVTLTRRFDRFFVGLSLRIDKLGEENALTLNIYPEGFGSRQGTGSASAALGR